MTASLTNPGAHRSRSWFGMFGGAIAWLLHLIGSSIVAEWGCLSGLYRWQFLGITAVAWTIVLITAATLLVAMLATWSAYRIGREYRGTADPQRQTAADDEQDTDVFMAGTGLWTSGLFVFIILAESIPVFYYFSEC